MHKKWAKVKCDALERKQSLKTIELKTIIKNNYCLDSLPVLFVYVSFQWIILDQLSSFIAGHQRSWRMSVPLQLHHHCRHLSFPFITISLLSFKSSRVSFTPLTLQFYLLLWLVSVFTRNPKDFQVQEREEKERKMMRWWDDEDSFWLVEVLLLNLSPQDNINKDISNSLSLLCLSWWNHFFCSNIPLRSIFHSKG